MGGVFPMWANVLPLRLPPQVENYLIRRVFPLPTTSQTGSGSPSSSVTPSFSQTQSQSASQTGSLSLSPSLTQSQSSTASASGTPSQTASVTASTPCIHDTVGAYSVTFSVPYGDCSYYNGIVFTQTAARYLGSPVYMATTTQGRRYLYRDSGLRFWNFGWNVGENGCFTPRHGYTTDGTTVFCGDSIAGTISATCAQPLQGCSRLRPADATSAVRCSG